MAQITKDDWETFVSAIREVQSLDRQDADALALLLALASKHGAAISDVETAIDAFIPVKNPGNRFTEELRKAPKTIARMVMRE